MVGGEEGDGGGEQGEEEEDDEELDPYQQRCSVVLYDEAVPELVHRRGRTAMNSNWGFAERDFDGR